jgi:hypothetical protein
LGATIVVLCQSKHHRAGAMDHLTSEIVIGPPSNPAEPGFSTRRVLAGHEANPCRKLSSRAKMATVVNRCNERGCDHGTDARQLRQAPAGFIRPAKGQELSVQFVEPEIKSTELMERLGEELPREIRKLRGRNGILRLRQKTPCALG